MTTTIKTIITIVIAVGIAVGASVAYQNYISPKETPGPTPQDLRIDKQPEQTPQQTSPRVDETKDWLTFINKKYSYSFKHPQGSYVFSNEYATSEDEAYNVALITRITKEISFNVEVRSLENLGLKEFTEKVWRLNKEDTNPYIKNKEVGEISQTTVSGRTAYQFTLTGSYQDESGGHVLDKKHLYLFVENNGLSFMIWFPSDNQVSQQILGTFKFVN